MPDIKQCQSTDTGYDEGKYSIIAGPSKNSQLMLKRPQDAHWVLCKAIFALFPCLALHLPQPPPWSTSSAAWGSAALSPESLDSRFLFYPLHRITGVPHHVRRGRGHQLRDHHQGEFRRRPPLRGPRVATAGIVFGARQLGAPTPLLLFSAGNPRAPVLGPLAAHSLCVRGRGWEAPRASVMPVGEWARGPQGPGGAGAAAERL